MKKQVLITIKGIYTTDGDRDVVELFTTGDFYKRGNNYYIRYKESEATGYDGTTTTLKVEPDRRVTLTRTGTSASQLIVERGVRHQCSYDAGGGPLTLGVSGGSIVTNLDSNGGSLEFKYSLDINTLLASENEVYVSVKQCS